MVKQKPIDPKLKVEIGLEAIKGKKTVAEIAKQYGVTQKQVRECKKIFLEKSPSLFSREADSPEKLSETKEEKTLLEAVKAKTDELTKDRRIKVFYAVVMAILTGFLVYYTANMACVSVDMARYTKDMSQYTSEMSRYTRELSELSKNPTLYIYCLIRSDFNFSISDGIQFEAADYLYHNKRAKFYIAVANKWGSNINDEMDIEFKISILDNEKYPVKIKDYKINDFRIALGPEDITEIYPVQEINKKLSGGDFNWQNSNSFKIIQVEIENSSVEVRHYPYAGVKVKYFGYDDFIKKYEEFKKRNNKEI